MDPRHFDTHRELADERTPLDALIEQEDFEAGYTATDEDAGMLARCEPGILGALLRFIIPPLSSPRRLKVANYRLICLAHLAGVDGIGNKSITDLASKLGITKAALSHWNTTIADELGQFQTRKGKSPAARAAYKISATRHHIKLGHSTPSLEHQEAADSV